jgi:hypothetical protein
MVSFIALFVAIVPHPLFQESTPYNEWWSSGEAVGLLVTGILLPIGGYLMLKKVEYAREAYLLILLITAMGFRGALLPSDASELLMQLLNVLARSWLGFLVLFWYLFRRPTVLEYFHTSFPPRSFFNFAIRKLHP